VADGLLLARSGLPDLTRWVRSIEREQVPFAAVAALTGAARLAREDIREGMQAAFDRPTRWTLNSTFVQPATRALPEASVYLKDYAPNGVPAGRYLRPEILSGMRALKSFEKRLGLPAPYITVPTRHADLDAYGNLAAGQRNALMAELDLFRSTVRRAQTRRRGARRGESYFVVRTEADERERVSYGLPATRTDATRNLPPGIYKTSAEFGGAPLLILAFVRQRGYRARFDFAGIGAASVERNLPRLIADAMAEFGSKR
jgi:hypothetical protein